MQSSSATRKRTIAGFTSCIVLAAGLQFAAPVAFANDADVERTISGTLADTTPYLFTVPADWNGTVFVDLDGARSPSGTARALINDGAAYGGTTRAVSGWNIAQALDNQAEALDALANQIGEATRTIAMGSSQGGFVAAGMAQRHPGAIDGVVAMCGGLSGSVSQWNQKLDTVFVLSQLLDPEGTLPVIDIPAVDPAVNAWQARLTEAQATPEGRARIALASAIGQLPALLQNEVMPDPSDPDTYQAGWYNSLAKGLPYIGQAMSSRRSISIVTGGNPSWNVGIDYVAQLANASDEARSVVETLYAEAGLSLDADLGTVNAAERIAADPDAVAKFAEGIQFNGDISVPVVTLDGIGDQISTVSQQAEYARLVNQAGNGDLLRQAFVPTIGHCGFTVSEQVTAAQLLLHRLDTGSWGDRDSVAALNEHATGLDLGAARFVEYQPDFFNRSPLDQDADGVPVTVSIVDQPGALVMTVADFGAGVELVNTGNAGDRWRYAGELPTVTVSDSRNAAQANGGGWGASGQSSAFTSDGSVIGAEHFGWAPRLLQAKAGVTAGDRSVTALDGGIGLSTPSTLAVAGNDGRRGSTVVGAQLFLDLPVDTAEGQYAAKVTVSLFPVD